MKKLLLKLKASTNLIEVFYIRFNVQGPNTYTLHCISEKKPF